VLYAASADAGMFNQFGGPLRLPVQRHIAGGFNLQDSPVILIDHQVGTNNLAATTLVALLQRNVIVLVKFAKDTGMPVVLTASQETNVNVQGPLMPELEDIDVKWHGS